MYADVYIRICGYVQGYFTDSYRILPIPEIFQPPSSVKLECSVSDSSSALPSALERSREKPSVFLTRICAALPRRPPHEIRRFIDVFRAGALNLILVYA